VWLSNPLFPFVHLSNVFMQQLPEFPDFFGHAVDGWQLTIVIVYLSMLETFVSTANFEQFLI